MTRPARRAVQRILQHMEGWFDPLFGQSCNPWRHLGGLSFFFFWIVAVSGLYLYAFFNTSVHGAFRSVEYLTGGQWYLGGIMRSLHRYASDALVVTMLLHLSREFINGRYRGSGWFSWISGVPLLWLVFSSGINGYWLVWDKLSQFIAIATAEWLDWLPIFAEPMARNFLTPEALNDRFFSLLVFLHIGIPLILLLAIWIHIQRISNARSKPPRLLAWGTFLALLALSLVKPAVSQAPADLTLVPANLKFDWFYLYLYPLLYQWSPGKVWALAGGGSLLLLLLPWVRRRPPQPVARVDLGHCNGCARCFADCPYAAITMQPRTDGRRFSLQATVNPDLCASCGICAGACPSSTPFRRASELVTGIDMPQLPIGEMRARLEEALAGLSGDSKVVVFGCDHAADVLALKAPGVAAFSLLCSAQLPPSFIEYALRNGADGVLLAGCREGDCYFRLGDRWMNQRISGEREPHLRRNAAPERFRVVPAGWVDQGKLVGELDNFRSDLKKTGAPESTPAKRLTTRRKGNGKPAFLVGQALGYALFFSLIGYFSVSPEYRHLPADQALLKLSFAHAGQFKAECRKRTAAELAALSPNMRAPLECTRARSPVTVRIDLDGALLYQETLPPSGLSGDGTSTVYRRFPISAGQHRLRVRLNDSVKVEGFNFEKEKVVSLRPNQVMIIDFNGEKGGITLK